MAKYYICSGDLQKIISTNLSPQYACKRAIDEFIEENTNTNKSFAAAIAISERGFRNPDIPVKNEYDDVKFYNIVDIVEL